MRIREIPYSRYERTVYGDRRLVRRFHRWDAWAATENGALLILLDQYVRRRVTVCEYDDTSEREADIRVLMTLSDVVPPAAGGGGTPPPTPAFAGLWPTPVAPLPPSAPTPGEDGDEEIERLGNPKHAN